jgi:alpha-ribazole phosphatase/probable phosphoglycerate mutase
MGVITSLLLVRHAQTDMAGTYCGHSDPPLNQAGRDQVRALLESLAHESFDAVYTSDLLRARQTATAAAEFFDVPCLALPGLREIDFGAWEGRTWSQVEEQDPGFAARWLSEFPALPAPGGESFSAFESRVLSALDEILTQQQHARVLIVSHAGVMRTILRVRCQVAEEEAWALTRSYCCTFRYPVPVEASR